MTQGVYVWSKTAGANATADTSINWAEGQAPSTVNDSARAMMARVAEFRDDVGGTILTSGTSTAYTASSSQGFAAAALMQGRPIVIVPHVTSGANPTLNIDGIGPRPLRCVSGNAISAGPFVNGTPYLMVYYDVPGEFRCIGAAIADGAISNANIGAAVVTGDKIAAGTITSTNLASGSVGAIAVAPSFVAASTCMINGTIGVSQGSGNMFIAIHTLAGADPTAADPTTFIFRDPVAATGDYIIRRVTSPLSITIPAGNSLGFLNATPGRFWLLALDVSGTVELAVFNACRLNPVTPIGVLNIFPLHAFGLIVTQAISGASSSGIAYSTTPRSAAYVPLGYMAWEVGLGGPMGTAGIWNVLPSRVQLFQPGSSPLPGDTIQQVYTASGGLATGSTVVPVDNTIPQSNEGDEYISQGLFASSSANALVANVAGHFSSGGGTPIIMSLFAQLAPGATIPNAVAVTTVTPSGGALLERLAIDYQMQASTLNLVTFRMRAGSISGVLTFNGEAAAAFFGGALNSNIRITEIMT